MKIKTWRRAQCIMNKDVKYIMQEGAVPVKSGIMQDAKNITNMYEIMQRAECMFWFCSKGKANAMNSFVELRISRKENQDTKKEIKGISELYEQLLERMKQFAQHCKEIDENLVDRTEKAMMGRTEEDEEKQKRNMRIINVSESSAENGKDSEQEDVRVEITESLETVKKTSKLKRLLIWERKIIIE